MPWQPRLISTWLIVAVLTYFILTAPTHAAALTHHVLGHLAMAANSGVQFLNDLVPLHHPGA